MRWLALSSLLVTACVTDVEVIGPDDPFWEDGYEHDEVGEEDELGSLSAPTQTVWSAATTGACSTAVVRGLAEQLVEEVECMRPGTMARIDGLPGVSLGAATFPYLQRPAADALGRAAAGRSMTLSSALRSTVQQFVLYTWYRRGRCTHVVSLAAPPGRSNHEAGLAIDVPSYSAARTPLGAQGFRWLGGSDPVHFDYTGGAADLRYLSVLAFQRLWNRNNPGDPISEDGAWGPQTEARMKVSPSAGFVRGSSCGAGVGAGVALEVGWERGADGRYALRAAGDASVARVEYRVDDVVIGAGAGDGFAASYAFDVEGAARRFEARGLDAAGAVVGRGVGLIDVVPGTAVYIRQIGRRLYEVGLERAPDDVAAIEVRADGFLVTDAVSGEARSRRGAVRTMFNQLGERSFEITTYGADGVARDTLRRTFVLE
jgi:hypothetical protein